MSRPNANTLIRRYIPVRKLLIIAALSASLLLPAASIALECGIDKDGLPVSAASSAVEVAFSPNGGAAELVVKTIESAKASIRVAAYSFTSKPISLALLGAHKRGVDVRLVVDKSNATARYTAATFLANQGVPVRVDYRYAIMHDKFVVVDGETVETGSFNFTAAAEQKNAENVIVLHDLRVAKTYEAEWERLWDESEEMKARY
jgi:phosphatidylserine/phosphatidylglycerophosphate/cardiolipin synthase-like enzyme